MVKSSARWPAEILAGPALLCSDSFSQQHVQIPSEADVTLLEVFFFISLQVHINQIRDHSAWAEFVVDI